MELLANSKGTNGWSVKPAQQWACVVHFCHKREPPVHLGCVVSGKILVFFFFPVILFIQILKQKWTWKHRRWFSSLWLVKLSEGDKICNSLSQYPQLVLWNQKVHVLENEFQWFCFSLGERLSVWKCETTFSPSINKNGGLVSVFSSAQNSGALTGPFRRVRV